MFRFDGKCIVVTGGSRGIGLGVAREFAAAGGKVAILARNADQAHAAAREIGSQAAAWSVDVSDENAVNETIGAIAEQWGRIDVLVNNAGVTRDKLLMRMNAEDWEQVLAINLRGTFLCSRAVLKPMLKQRAGRIIAITSVIGLMGNPGQANYAASKAGIIGFTKSLAKEVASRAITVNAIAPGMIDTDMTRALAPEGREAILRAIPLGRLGSAGDVAAAALFLASDAAGYITGEVLRVDGGMAI